MKRILVLVLLALIAASAAFAGTTSANMNVTATLVPTVTLTTTDLAFGTFAIGDSYHFATGSITVSANSGMPYVITMDAGQHPGGPWGRNVANGSSVVSYYIADPTYTYVWGDAGYANTISWAGTVGGTGTGSAQVITFEGGLDVPDASPSSAIGSYSDVVLVTVNY